MKLSCPKIDKKDYDIRFDIDRLSSKCKFLDQLHEKKCVTDLVCRKGKQFS